MKIKFYGVRGSYPVPGPNTVKYGGNTTCVSFTEKVHDRIYRVIIDSGTGIIQLGKDIIKNYLNEKEFLEFPIFFTHLHPDHTQGFPFFAPNFFHNAKINLYGMETLHEHIGIILSRSMTPPQFPLEYNHLKSQREHQILDDGSTIIINALNEEPVFQIDVMQAYAPSHPQQGALYYKIKSMITNKSVACIWDNESKIGGDKAVINFARGCDAMIHDTQYTKKEYDDSKMIVQGFGHSTYEMAIDNAGLADIEKLYCIHYNPAHSDAFLDDVQLNFDADFVTLVKEGQVIDL
jgi:ribonuclease BN (tRNA processing enzyme)